MVYCYKNRTSGGRYKDFQDQHTENLNSYVVHVKIHPLKFLNFYANYARVEVNSIAIDPNFVLIHMIFVIYYCV